MIRILGASLLTAFLVIACARLPAGTDTPSTSPQDMPSPSLTPVVSPAGEPSTGATTAPKDSELLALRPSTSPAPDVTFSDLVAAPDGFVAVGSLPDSAGPVLARGSVTGDAWQQLDAGSVFGGVPLTGLAISDRGWVASQRVSRPDGGIGARLWWSPDGSAWRLVPDQASLGRAFEGPVASGGWGFAMAGQAVDDQGSSWPAVWTSRDGLTWQQIEGLPHFQPDQVAVLSNLVVGTEYQSGRSAVSVDGRTWSQPSSGPPGYDDGMTRIAAVDDRMVALSAARSGFALFVATTGTSGVTWKPAGGPELFGGAGATALAGGPGGGVVLGFDRKTLAPLVWVSADGLIWKRLSPPSATFGGGVPGSVGIGSRAIVSLGWYVSEAGVTRARAWSSTDGLSWVGDDSETLGRLPAPPSAGCPATAPTDVAGLAAMLDAYPPMPMASWPFCFGARELTIKGYVQGCGGCGGIADSTGRPSWLIDGLGYSAFWLGTKPNGWDEGARMGVWVDPAHPISAPAPGTLVRVTGHFDDPASESCRLIPLDWITPFQPAAETVGTCRQHFVATGVAVVRS